MIRSAAMKSFIVSLFCLLFFNYSGFSQNIPELSGPESVPLHLMGPHGPYYQSGEHNVVGSPYLHDGEWVSGIILKPSGHPTEELEFRYDMTREELEVKYRRNGQEMVLLVPPKNVKGFTVKDEPIMVFRNGFRSDDKNINRYTLMQVIYDGETKLVKYYKTKLIEGRQPDYRTGRLTDKFVDNDRYYMTDDSGKLVSVKLKKRSILKQLSGNTNTLEQYTDQRDLSFDSESDLVQILKYYDEQLL